MSIAKKTIQSIISVATQCSDIDSLLNILHDELNQLENSGELTLFNPDNDIEKEFHLSRAYIDEVWKVLLKKEYDLGIDIFAYKEQVDIWNSTVPKKDKRKKRNVRGWAQTARMFMKSDKDKGKLLILKSAEDTSTIDYLKL